MFTSAEAQGSHGASPADAIDRGGLTMFRRNRVIAALFAACVGGAFLVVDGAEGATTRSGVISKFDGIDEIVEACTTTTNFVTVPQMTRTFTISGAASSVVVTFSGSASLSGSQQFDTGFLRLTIDGAQQTPGVVPFVAAGELTQSHAFTWQTRSLTVGQHTARVQWRTDLGSSFCLDARSLIVLHR
jgi:hypothetical protein